MEMKTNKHLTPILILLIFIQPLLTSARWRPLPPPAKPGKAHFVLVHGAGYGAWCWFKIIPILKSHGHNVTALDLATSGINLRSAETLRSISEYFGPLMDLMESLDEHQIVILVAHSLGGLAISKAMEMFPQKVHVAVFVTALMPGPSLNVTSVFQGLARWPTPQLDMKFVFGDGPDKPPTLSIGGPLYISQNMYNLSPIEDFELAMLLVRPSRVFSNEDMEKNLVLTKEKFGSVNRIFIESEKDKTLKIQFQRWMIKNNPPDRVETIKGSDHMVMISRPCHLAAHLLAIAKKFKHLKG